ncbi:MAG: DUF937 domain-containing protein [Pseudomonadota bacterium]
MPPVRPVDGLADCGSGSSLSPDPSLPPRIGPRYKRDEHLNVNELLPICGINALASQLGISPDRAGRGAQALLPALVGGMGANSGAIGEPCRCAGRAELADNVVGPPPTQPDRGNQLLGEIVEFGEFNRGVCDHAAQPSGIRASVLKKMLPILAMLAAGHLAKRAGGQQGGLGRSLRPSSGTWMVQVGWVVDSARHWATEAAVPGECWAPFWVGGASSSNRSQRI